MITMISEIVFSLLKKLSLSTVVNKRFLAYILLTLSCAPIIVNAGGYSAELDIKSIERISQFNREDAGCANWQIDKPTILKAFKKMRQVPSEVWGMACEAYSCAYTGKAYYGGSFYDYEVNAGGAIILFNDKKALHFIDTTKRKYFLSFCRYGG